VSDFHAIGGVSATLHALLRDRMELPNNLADVPVTVATPVPDPLDPGVEAPRVNVFLYRVTENAFLKNQEIPGEGNVGAYGHPPLSLVLHYLLTAYGSKATGDDHTFDERLAHFLLGSAMRVLHDYPVITEDLKTVRPTSGVPILDGSLLGEFERVKLCLDPITLEDVSKVWTALSVRYRLSAAYTVSVVQIESQQPRRFPRPVGEPPSAGPRIYVFPVRAPRIDELRVHRPADPPGTEHPLAYARVGDTLIVQGGGFSGSPIVAVVRDIRVPVAPASEQRIEFTVPDDTLPDGSAIPPERQLRAGAQLVEIVIGIGALPQTGFHSNQAVFMLVPRVDAVAQHARPDGRALSITGARLVDPGLTGETIIGQTVTPKTLYLAAAPQAIDLLVPDALPGWPAQCLLSGPTPTLPAGSPAVQVTIGGVGPLTASFSPPADLAGAARLLEAAIQAAFAGQAIFSHSRVTTVDGQLLVVPGGLLANVVFSTGAAGPAADQLQLTAAQGASNIQAYLSGEFAPFPQVTAASPQLQVQIGAVTHVVTLSARPATVSDAAQKLQAAIQAAAGPGEVGFSKARVAPLGSQLIVVPGAAGTVAFSTVPGGDATTVTELGLTGTYAVRVRVNAAEDIDNVAVSLP
jgi:uncharacterized protein DUF4255